MCSRTIDPWYGERTPYTQGMGKKRRVWWIVGALVVAVALFAAVAFYIDYNNTYARMERAVAQIVQEYGFEPQNPPRWSGFELARPGSVTEFRRAPVSAETAGEIVDFIRGACPSLDYKHSFLEGDYMPATMGDGDPWPDVHKFSRKELGGGVGLAVVTFIPDNGGYGIPEFERTARLGLVKMDGSSLWQRIKGLWPW